MSRLDLPEEIESLTNSISAQNNCVASYLDTIPVCEMFKGAVVWNGAVLRFALSGHPKATMCYAWYSPIDGSKNRRVYMVLGVPPVNSATDAVRASIASDHKSKK